VFHEDVVSSFYEILSSFDSIASLRLGAIHNHKVLSLKARTELIGEFEQRSLCFLGHLTIVECLEGTGLFEYLRGLEAIRVYLQIDQHLPEISDQQIVHSEGDVARRHPLHELLDCLVVLIGMG
jgi:hypothetical protein